MSADIRKHVHECDACQRTKTTTKPPSGLLEPLSISQRPWQSISINYLGLLPKSQNGKDMILVIID